MKLAAHLRNAFLQAAKSFWFRRCSSQAAVDVQQSGDDVTGNNVESDVTRRLNEIYADEDVRLDPVIAELQRRSITKEQW